MMQAAADQFGGIDALVLYHPSSLIGLKGEERIHYHDVAVAYLKGD